MRRGTAIVIGAGPAGLTAALELERSSEIKPVVIEASRMIGGLARTVCYKGNRMDIGGHRFFSKSDRVMQWWLDMMPVEDGANEGEKLRYQGQEREIPAAPAPPDPQTEDLLMLVRRRKSRIYFRRRFFDYPFRLSAGAVRNLGAIGAAQCGLSYLRSALLPQREERSLEDFLINRFGKRLYLKFFKPYTEKVWGAPCREISAEWGAQRIKSLSPRTFAMDFLRQATTRNGSGDLRQKRTETSLIERFLYPKLGAGQMWEHVAELVAKSGGEIHLGTVIDRIHVEGNRVVAIDGVNEDGVRSTYAGDYFISTMPVRDLIQALACEVPQNVMEVSEDLRYRDLMIVGLLARKLSLKEDGGSPIRDTWIYIHEPDVAIGRIQIFNNWSPWLVADSEKVWIGLEYFCGEAEPLWKLSDREMARLAIEEAATIGILKAEDVEDWHVVRALKAYPAYFGSYSRFEEVRRYVDSFENLFLVGRNGMHRYNNQDHSMLTAMTAVENIVNGVTAKHNIWAINTEMDYHEQEAGNRPRCGRGAPAAGEAPAPSDTVRDDERWKTRVLGSGAAVRMDDHGIAACISPSPGGRTARGAEGRGASGE